MRTQTFDETPLTVVVRIFGATTVLLLAMMVFLHPDIMGTAMSHVMILVN